MSPTNLKGKTVLVTGASSGIGEAIARRFAAEGCRLILAARRLERLVTLRRQLLEERQTEALCLKLDVKDRQMVEDSILSLPALWRGIDILVNNAGLSRGLEKFQDGNIDDWEEMIQTNLSGLLYVTRMVLPRMVERGHGHIINLGSVAGHSVYPRGNVYCATKAAVLSLTEALRQDLVETPIRVTTIDPGLVGGTEFSMVRFHGDADKAAKPYQGITPISPADVAEAVVWSAMRPAHVQVAEMVLTATHQATGWLIHRKTP